MALRASIRHHAAKQSAEFTAAATKPECLVTGTRPLPSVEQPAGGVGVRSSPNKPAIASICGNGSNGQPVLEQKLNALAAITLTLTADEVASALAQHVSNAHCVSAWSHCMGRLFPDKNVWRSYRSLSRTSLWSRRNVMPHLTKCAIVIKKKRNNLPM